MSKVGISELVLRDAHQSLHATRMTTADMLPACEMIDKIGYWAVEGWGGATYDSCIRFLNEDPWERLRKLHAALPNNKIMMLLRGQNLLGYRHYADDVVDKFVETAAKNGIDVFRIFDACNDPRNLERATKAAKKTGKHVQMAISYAVTPYHTIEKYAELAKTYAEFGADSICIKDMSGLLLPYDADKLIRAMKSATNLPIQLHTHYTSGLASMTYLKAVEAGVDVIDCAISPFSMGTAQPATEVMVETFKGTPYDTGYDQKILGKIADHFRPYREECIKSGLLDPKVMGVNIKTLIYQVPGGMLSNMVSQLKEQNASDKYDAVLEEVPNVRKDFGEPPLVTPSSQIVGTQAVMNVLMGERYKVASGQTKDLLSGKYGKTIKPFNPEVQKKVIGDAEVITCRPADLLEPGLAKFEEEVKAYKQQDEDTLSYALFPQVATDFFKYRQAQQDKVDVTAADTANGAYPV